MTIAMTKWTAMVAVLLMAPCVFSQEFEEDEELQITVSLDVGYNTAYRDGFWAPVDVYIENEQEEVEGWVEVRLYDLGNERLSPVYRIPAICPQDSQKRFRLYAWMEGVARVEAVLYEGERLAVDAPSYIEPRPVEEDDFLALILDDSPLNHQYFFDTLGLFDTRRRLQRQDLGSGELAKLPDRLECYNAVDLIVIGDVDLSRFPVAQRDLLINFVERGGTLAVYTGVAAQRVRDSWLAPHLGARIGAADTIDVVECEERFLGIASDLPEASSGLCSVAELGTDSARATVFGVSGALVTRREFGSGRFLTFAIDPGSGALQKHPAFLELWKQILVNGQRTATQTDFGHFDRTFVNSLPQVSGVTIRPVEDVVIYLGSYIVIGIILNWLVWNRLGRREYAWLTLLFVSFAYSAYAVFSGASGLQGRMARHTVTVHELKSGSAFARSYSVTGLLSARVTEIDEEVGSGASLVREAGGLDASAGWGMTGAFQVTPFRFVQSDPATIEGFRVGANSVRGFSESHYTRLNGGVTGDITFGPAGVEARIANDTGIEVSSPVLYLNGEFYPLERDPDTGDYVPVEKTKRAALVQRFDVGRTGSYWPNGFYSGNWNTLLHNLMMAPLVTPALNGLDPLAGPYFIGRDMASDALLSGSHTNENKQVQFIFAQVPAASKGTVSFPLATRGDYGNFRYPKPWDGNGWDGNVSMPQSHWFATSERMLAVPESKLVVELSFRRVGDFALQLAPKEGGGPAWQREHLVDEGPHPHADGAHTILRRYELADWRDYLDPDFGSIELELRVVSRNSGETRNSAPMNYHLYPMLQATSERIERKEWLGWR